MSAPAQRSSLRFVTALAAAAVTRGADAEPPSADLMTRLAVYGGHLETLRTRASYTFDGRLETLDREGRTDSVKDMRARVTAEGSSLRLVVLSYTEDGKDKTDDARKKASEKAEHKGNKKPIRTPILAEEQPRYVFDQVAVDPADPTRVRIAFSPKVPAEDTIEGSAWVDTQAATLLSAGFMLSKTPMFVDYVHFTMEFGASTALGPAVSVVRVEGKGGLPFFRKHFRGEATVGEYSIAP